MSYEEFRCMMPSEDDPIDGPAFCVYPECWLETCPHKQARDELEFIHEEYGNANPDSLTRDALILKIKVLEQELHNLRKKVKDDG